MILKSAHAGYTDLLAEAVPHPIHSEEEADAIQERMNALLDKRETRTEDEENFLELLGALMFLWEDGKYELPAAEPHERVRALLEDNGLRQKDLVPHVFPTESVASEVLAGKRKFTYDSVDRLAEYFHVPVDLFYTSHTR